MIGVGKGSVWGRGLDVGGWGNPILADLGAYICNNKVASQCRDYAWMEQT